MVTAGPVDVAMGEFFLRGIPDLTDGDVKVEIGACQRVVAIKRDLAVGEFGDGDNLRSFSAAGLELAADFELGHPFNLRPGDGKNFLAVMLAITFFGSNIHLKSIADDLAIKRLFQTRDDVPTAVNISERFMTFRGVDGLFLIVSESVVDEDDFAGSDLHGESM